MSWVSQGLAKYECCECTKQFLVGLIDVKEQEPICCPFCKGSFVECTVHAEPNQDYSQWLDDMGCMGIHYQKEGD